MVKPSENEEDYFARQEFDRRQKAAHENQARFAAEEKTRLKELHDMRCPKCGMELIEIDYNKIKIDKCSECGGIWLDAGELETITSGEESILGKFAGMFKSEG